MNFNREHFQTVQLYLVDLLKHTTVSRITSVLRSQQSQTQPPVCPGPAITRSPGVELAALLVWVAGVLWACVSVLYGECFVPALSSLILLTALHGRRISVCQGQGAHLAGEGHLLTDWPASGARSFVGSGGAMRSPETQKSGGKWGS